MYVSDLKIMHIKYHDDRIVLKSKGKSKKMGSSNFFKCGFRAKCFSTLSLSYSWRWKTGSKVLAMKNTTFRIYRSEIKATMRS